MRNDPVTNEHALLEKLRAGDEAAFAALVDRFHGRLFALATTFTRSPSLAEDIVQETWLAVIRGLRSFEARSTLGTWMYGILVRRARTMAAREARTEAVAALTNGHANGGEVEWSPGLGRVGLWDRRPVPWGLQDPAEMFQSREVMETVAVALGGLPPAQRQVVLLRDVEGLAAGEVCNILDLTETNQRVLLHRGRARIRRALDDYLREGARPPFAAGTPTNARRGTRG